MGIFWSKFKYVTIFLLSVLIALSFGVQTGFAHRPHDIISQVELSPTYDRDRTVFIIVRGNLFKSQDGGSFWKRLVRNLDKRNNLSSLSIDPQNKEILYLSSLGDGIYKSQDEGESWIKVNNGLETLAIDLLSVSPDSSEVVLAAGQEKGLYKTKNGGESWSRVIEDGKILSLEFVPDKDRGIAGDDRGNLYISQEGGEVWEKKFTIEDGGGITALAISPNFAEDRTFFVGTESGGIFKTVYGGEGVSLSEANQGLSDKLIRDVEFSPNYERDSTVWAVTWHKGIFQSTNGGETWTRTSNGLTKDRQADDFETSHFNEVRASNNFSQDQTIFIGGFNGLFKSIDGGNVWQELDTLSSRTVVSLSVSPDYSNDSTIAIADYVGRIYTSTDRGVTWTATNKGLEVPRFTNNFKQPYQDPRRFFDLYFSPNYASDNTIFATLLWHKFLRSTDGGKHWERIPLAGIKGYSTRGMTIVPSPNFTVDNTIYLGTINGVIYQSTDGGKSFSILQKLEKRKTNEPISLVISPDFSADKTLFISGDDGVYKSLDSGQTWFLKTQGNPWTTIRKLKLAISPNYAEDKTVFIGTETGVFQTQDGGESWEKLAGDAYGGDGYIESIAISPTYKSDRTFLISVRGKGLFKTVDGGKIFKKIGDDSILLSRITNVPSASEPIQFSPTYASDRTIYGFGSAEAELYRSADAGETWEAIAIPNYRASGIDIITQLDLLFYVYRPEIIKLAATIIVTLFSYIILGYLSLERRFPFTRSQIQVFCSVAIFILALIILYA